MAAKHKRFNVMLKFADYEQGVLATARNTQKVWAQSNSSGNGIPFKKKG